MSSNRLRVLLVSMLAVFAVGAVASGSASAAVVCVRVAEPGTGNWNNNICTVGDVTNEYIRVLALETKLKPGEWCAKVEEKETGNYTKNNCEAGSKKAKSEFIKVMAACYPVAEPETGRFATSATCEARTPVIAKGAWINISKLEKEVKAGEWCAKVEVKETGNYATLATCEAGTPKVAKGEFIRVKVSQDIWQVCQKGGTEKWSEHKCNAGKGTGEWSWLPIEAGKSFEVTSKGGEFKLKTAKLTVTCKNVTDTGTIEPGGKDKATKITFTVCTTGQAGCKVRSSDKPAFGTINVTNIPTKLEQRLVGEEEILVDNFEQKEVEPGKFEFVTLQFEPEAGKSCSEYPETKVKGTVAAEVINLANGNVELNFPATALINDTLNAFGVSATLTGKVEEELVNGWAFRGV